MCQNCHARHRRIPLPLRILDIVFASREPMSFITRDQCPYPIGETFAEDIMRWCAQFLDWAYRGRLRRRRIARLLDQASKEQAGKS